MAAAVGKGSGVGWAMSSEVHRPGWGVHTPSLYLRHVLIFPEPGFLWCKSGLETPLLEVTGVRRVLVQSLCLVIRTCRHGIMAAKELYELLNFKECRMGSGRSPLALVLVQWVSVAVATRNDNLGGSGRGLGCPPFAETCGLCGPALAGELSSLHLSQRSSRRSRRRRARLACGRLCPNALSPRSSATPTPHVEAVPGIDISCGRSRGSALAMSPLGLGSRLSIKL